MRQLSLISIIAATIVAFHVNQGSQHFVNRAQAQERPDFIEGEVLVRLKPGSARDLHKKIQGVSAQVSGEIPELRIQKWKVPSTSRALEALANNPNIEFVEPNGLYYINQLVPNDPKFGSLWGLHNSSDTDIDAPEAWETVVGGNTVVAILDTGVDYNHPDLVDNIWTNPGEIAGNGIDDDKNGYIDDVIGYDFADGDSDPAPSNSHGTHIAGTVAATGNNGIGVVGVNWNAQIMPLKVCSTGGGCSWFALAKAVTYAAKHGANAANISIGGSGYSSTLYSAMQEALNYNIAFAVAAGNSGSDNDTSPIYPASFNLDNIVAVAALTSSGGKPSWSNYGLESVDVGAPGSGILSTLAGGGYGNKSGTSMAAPHVAGALTLLYSASSSMTYTKAKSILISSVDPVASMDGRTVSGGRINIARAIAAIGTPDPTTISATNDSASTSEGQTVSIDVLNNDSTTSSGGMDIIGVSTAGNGQVAIENLGSYDSSDKITYTPNPGFSGSDSFTYTVEDVDGNRAEAVVDVNVSSLNNAPSATNDSAELTAGQQVTIQVLSNDSDPDGDGLDIVDIAAPQAGSASIQNNGSYNSTDAIIYTAPSSFEGTVSFSYTVADSSGAKSTASVTITVTSSQDDGSTALQANSITPATVNAGNYTLTVEVSGDGFQNGVVVDISGGSGPAPKVQSVSQVDSTLLRVTVTLKDGGPPRARVHTVTVTNPNGQIATVPGGFTIQP